MPSGAFTLESVLKLHHGARMARANLRLMRHTCSDDHAILRREFPGLEPAAIERPLLRGDDKLGSLRMDPTLVECFSSEQSSDRLTTAGKRAELLLAFVAAGGDRAEYLGAWDVKGLLPVQEWRKRYYGYVSEPTVYMKPYCERGRLLIDLLGLSAGPHDASVYYDLAPRPDILPGLAGRLVISWDHPINWIRSSLDQPVAEVRPGGFVKPFTEYHEVSLSWDELAAIVERADGNPEWRSALSSVAGIYLITDTRTGRLYVGSASGADGVWGRWCGYADRQAWHNGNLGLRALFEEDRRYARYFRFALLQVMGQSTSKAAVIEWESMWKERLGSRAVALGYNRN